MKRQFAVVPVVCVMGASALVAQAGAQGSLQGIGDLTGGIFSSTITATNANGSIIVGHSESANGTEGFYWTVAGGLVGIGDLPGGAFVSRVYDIADNAFVLTGTGIGAGGQDGFVYTPGGGMVPMGDGLDDGLGVETPFAISDDGAYIAGNGWFPSTAPAPMRWSVQGGMEQVFGLEGQAHDINGDGSVIVGESFFGDHGFRWVDGLGEEIIGDMPAVPNDYSVAKAVTPDGTVVVGNYETLTGFFAAYRWVEGKGASLLPMVSGGGYSTMTRLVMNGISADGNAAVGRAFMPGMSVAVRWTPEQGTRRVTDILEQDLGVKLNGWQLLEATDISHDGNVIVGNGINPSGQPEGFIVTLGASVCSGDCDGSGAVDFNDLVSILFEFGELDAGVCDADDSGAVDFNDLVATLFLFGPCAP